MVHVKLSIGEALWLSGRVSDSRARGLGPHGVLERDTLLPESIGNTQAAVTPSRHE